jgi:hypothetical protein
VTRTVAREIPVAGLYTLRPADSKVVRMQLFPTVEAAVDFASDSS